MRNAPEELEGVPLLLQGVLGGALAHDVHLRGGGGDGVGTGRRKTYGFK